MAAQHQAAVILAIRGDIATAADAILSEAEESLAALTRAKRGDASGFERLEEGLSNIMQSCAFEDLAGQRLSALAKLFALDPPRAALAETATAAEPAVPVNGPALPGEGLDQATADRLLAGEASTPDPAVAY